MPVAGYVDYKPREYCNDVKCPVQMDLNKCEKGSEEYEKIRQICRTDCRHTTWEFHHWLIEKRYLVVRPENRK